MSATSTKEAKYSSSTTYMGVVFIASCGMRGLFSAMHTVVPLDDDTQYGTTVLPERRFVHNLLYKFGLQSNPTVREMTGTDDHDVETFILTENNF